MERPKETKKRGESPVNKKNKQGKKLHNRNLWMCVGMLTITVIITAALVSTYLFNLSTQNVSAISLYKGLLKNETTSKITQPKAESKVLKLKGTQAKKQGFKVQDKEQVWTTNTKVELFKLSYNNKDGKITVKSANKEKVIAPGTEGSYRFSVKNTGTKTAKYKIWTETGTNTNVTKIPITISIAGKDKLSEQKSIKPGESIGYTIRWEWPFEQGDDGLDTLLGNLKLGSQNQEVKYDLTIHTIATDAGPQSTDEDNDNNKRILFSHSGRTADNADILLWSSIAAMSVIAIGVIIILCRRRKEDEEKRI